MDPQQKPTKKKGQTSAIGIWKTLGKEDTLPETNSHFAPENGWFQYDRFLLGLNLFSGAFAVSFREGT